MNQCRCLICDYKGKDGIVILSTSFVYDKLYIEDCKNYNSAINELLYKNNQHPNILKLEDSETYICCPECFNKLYVLEEENI